MLDHTSDCYMLCVFNDCVILFTDDEFLLSFLRWSKFSMLRAQQIVDNFWTARTSEKDWFDSMDPADPKLQEIMDLGQQFPLGRNDEGQMVIYIRTGE